MRDASMMPSLGSPELERRNSCLLSAASRGTQPQCIQAAGEGRNSSHREEESGKEMHSKAAGTAGSVEPSSVLHTAFLAGLSPRALRLLPFFPALGAGTRAVPLEAGLQQSPAPPCPGSARAPWPTDTAGIMGPEITCVGQLLPAASNTPLLSCHSIPAPD